MWHPGNWFSSWGNKKRAPGGFPVSIGRKAMEEIRADYAVLDASNNVTLTVHSGAHVFRGKDFWPRLTAFLGPAAAPFGNELAMRNVWDCEPPAGRTGTDAHRRELFHRAERNSRQANERSTAAAATLTAGWRMPTMIPV